MGSVEGDEMSITSITYGGKNQGELEDGTGTNIMTKSNDTSGITGKAGIDIHVLKLDKPKQNKRQQVVFF